MSKVLIKVFNARLNLFLACNSLIWIGWLSGLRHSRVHSLMIRDVKLQQTKPDLDRNICDHAAGELCIMDFAATIQ